jgi:glutamyl-tRNA synthetase
MTVRVRFAPSPTGEPHIGNVRTVVFNWLFARKTGGQFILRIEDTDRKRYQPESITAMMDGLQWLGLQWDEGPALDELVNSGVPDAGRYAVGGHAGPYIQSERLDTYQTVAEELISRGYAYRCDCTPERLDAIREDQRNHKLQLMYDRHCRSRPAGDVSPDSPHVVRLKVPLEGQTIVHDVIRGDVAYDNATIDDQVLVKSDGFPTYHLAVVVDDHAMSITHIIRADHWIPSTPKHILMYQAMGWDLPTYCHVPLVLGDDGKPLAKRHGATSVSEFRRQGYLPEALLNYLALLGWSPGEGDEQEVFGRDELIDRFDLFRVSHAPSSFSYDKLDWMNGVHIRNLSDEALLADLLPVWRDAGLVTDPCPEDVLTTLRRAVPLVRERLKRLTEVVEWTDFLLRDIVAPEAMNLVGRKMTPQQSLAALRSVSDLVAAVAPFEPEAIESPMRSLANTLGVKAGSLFGIVRWAITGKKVAPPLFGSLAALGRDRALSRLATAESALASYIGAQAATSREIV